MRAYLCFHCACMPVCMSAEMRARLRLCLCARACMRYIRRAHARLGESVRGSCRVNVVAGLIAAECERRRRRQWTLCWRVSSDHRCGDDNCTVPFYVLVNTFITILHYILDSLSDLHLTHVGVDLHVEMVYQSSLTSPQVEPEFRVEHIIV